MSKKKMRVAVPIKIIRDRQTGEFVGWLYRWNTGAESVMWVSGPREDVIFC